DPGREPAAVAAGPHLLPAVAPLRQLLAGDHLPWRRTRRGMEAVPDGQCHRDRMLHIQRATLPQVDRGHEMSRPHPNSTPHASGQTAMRTSLVSNSLGLSALDKRAPVIGGM